MSDDRTTKNRLETLAEHVADLAPIVQSDECPQVVRRMIAAELVRISAAICEESAEISETIRRLKERNLGLL